ncbi:hypothetical protein EDI_096300 [Entamoeba dispar SAW760]|uniref:Leucine rich repeat containing protein BspA family protein n=1 Tax=Entamoeba dispar (strain ATCC PRA-260 / SAW760) TaxID=370354 RepID=B0EPR6_ENTDS|nr:uncharacterized protein EDI_096300 [Entamoeba dispar SAW760]EDR23496.1 hypothetical protein EDI_096300 [Entamoeba dispar SAW760]|eukprot:EDR23496.1 hypothetical protein EDI_096300 [Entamoeba dispar SAW760]
MIVSMYFDDINDFINLEIGIKRFQGNMERFHFNPISLNKYSRKLFHNIETFHICDEDDEIFNDGRILKNSCFKGCETLTIVTIPSMVTEIGNECFNGYKIFINEQNITSFEICNLKRINGKEIERRDINKFVIPTKQLLKYLDALGVVVNSNQ